MSHLKQRWAPACGLSPAFCFPGWDKILSDLTVQVQAALVDETPHYLGDLLIVFSIQKAGNENTSFAPFADSSGFWCRPPGEAVVQ